MSLEQAVDLTVDELLDEACARNTPAELHYESRTGDRSVSRVRLLELTDTEILADTPLSMGANPPIPPNRPITVHMVLNASRWQFESAITQLGVEVRLNEDKMVKGVSLKRPQSVSPSQRRADFRLSLASFAPIEAQLVKPHPDHPEACVWPGVREAARIVDLSAGGAGLLMKRGQIRDAKRNEEFFLSFSLPGVEDSFEMLGSVRHTRLLHDATALRLALSFAEWGSGTFMSDQSRIARFIADCQRNSMKRRK